MTSKLVLRLVQRGQENDTRMIQEMAEVGASEIAMHEHEVSDLAVLQTRAQKLGTLMVTQFRDEHRGAIRKLFRQDKPVITGRFQPRKWGIEQNIWTPLLHEERVLVAGQAIATGIRMRLTRQMYNTWHGYGLTPKSKEEHIEGFFHNALSIDQAAVDIDTGEAETERLYEVGLSNASIGSFTDGLRDDDHIVISKQAGAHALGLINHAIVLLDS